MSIKGVYCLTSPSGKRYVGIGIGKKGINSRFQSYKNLHKSIKSQTKIYNALKKYGPENFKYEVVLETDDVDNAKRSEMYLIDVWNLQDDRFGYNISPGGDCFRHNIKMSELQKSKISLANKGKNKPHGFGFGKRHSKETKLKMSKAHYGKKMSSEAIEKIRLNKIGNIPWNKSIVYSNELKQKISETTKKYHKLRTINGKRLYNEIEVTIYNKLTGEKRIGYPSDFMKEFGHRVRKEFSTNGWRIV